MTGAQPYWRTDLLLYDGVCTPEKFNFNSNGSMERFDDDNTQLFFVFWRVNLSFKCTYSTWQMIWWHCCLFFGWCWNRTKSCSLRVAYTIRRRVRVWTKKCNQFPCVIFCCCCWCCCSAQLRKKEIEKITRNKLLKCCLDWIVAQAGCGSFCVGVNAHTKTQTISLEPRRKPECYLVWRKIGVCVSVVDARRLWCLSLCIVMYGKMFILLCANAKFQCAILGCEIVVVPAVKHTNIITLFFLFFTRHFVRYLF